MSRLTGNDQHLQMLLSRLKWPSGLVRERACTAIAHLLMNPVNREIVLKGLLEWIHNEPYESTASYGILPLIRSKQLGSEKLISGRDLWNELSAKSILSWLLIQYFDPTTDVPFETSLVCSDSASLIFKAGPFFDKHVRSFVPIVFDWRANQIDKRFAGQFRIQWQFEWAEIIRRTGVAVSEHALDYWLGRAEDDERTLSVDTHMSEVYRSAYLRALARFCVDKQIRINLVQHLAAECCPLDIGLWSLNPASVPIWWPRISSEHRGVDTSIGEIWHQVERLWVDQPISEQDYKWRLAQASGRISSGENVYELEIFGFFQNCDGPNEPEAEAVYNWCSSINTVRALSEDHSFLSSAGIVDSQLDDRDVTYLADWNLVTANNHYTAWAVPRWQPWRIQRQMWMPSPGLLEVPITAVFTDDALSFWTDDELIGRWRDWTDGVTEERLIEFPSQSGEYLVVSPDIIDALCRTTSSNFCWLCKLTRFYRESEITNTYKSYVDFKIFGASQIIRP